MPNHELNAEQALDLATVVRDYRDALRSGNNDQIADTSEALDATICMMGLGVSPLYQRISATYEEECDLDDAAATLDRVLTELLTSTNEGA